MHFNEIISRIKEIKNLYYDSDVAKLLGYTKNAFAERKRRNSVPQDKLELFCEREHININWLLTGEGPKYREEKALPDTIGESPAAYGDERLAALVKKLQYIYNKGSVTDRALARGTIEEVYDILTEKTIDTPDIKKMSSAG